ncbi:lipid-A-disaccharide synthase [Arvimicrobium flavum]|uniref:lipid-A-disaccharide synthase n=1 Tax=Arvimicrobium flavum TaxID=3393320 RepID=UPI00237BF530|nr:lipid-A-disaccharide synthase [Mesorhizobium shangrilense]
MISRALKIAIVSGEESGDLLGADIVRALRAESSGLELVGVGGRHLQDLGLTSLFDAGEIALMGIGAIVRDLPRLMRRISQTAREIVAAKPDCLITIDSPEFSLRVARKVRAAAPDIPIIHYVCPSVWAWRPKRAPAMRGHVDHILCILPFEVEALARLGGPPGTYVGHRLTHDPSLLRAAQRQAEKADLSPGREKKLLVLPGSRRGEVSGLIDVFGEAVSSLQRRGHRLKVLMPTVPHVAQLVANATTDWDVKPEITVEPERKWKAFGEADAAMIASGTVSLELALAGVPMYSCYTLDPIAKLAVRMLTTWSALLPNIIADRPIVTEVYDRYIRSETIVRHMEALFCDTSLRAWQKEGFAEVARRMAVDRPAGEIAAGVVRQLIEARRGR